MTLLYVTGIYYNIINISFSFNIAPGPPVLIRFFVYFSYWRFKEAVFVY